MLPRRGHLLHDLITQVFFQRLKNGIVVMGFIDVFVSAHHQHRRNIENPRNLGDCMKEENQIHDGYHLCLRSRVPGNMPHKTHACGPTLATFAPQHEKEAMTPRDGPPIQTGILALWMVKPWLGGVRSLDFTMNELMLCLVLSSRRELILPSQVPELAPTKPLK